MIWHMLKKDMALLWPMVLIASLAHAARAVLSIVLGPLEEPAELRVLAYVFPYASMFALVALVGLVVHQEALIGTEQDWLVRPVRRRDLLLEKLLFILALGHGPLFLSDLLECLGLGMGFGTSVSAALSDAFLKFVLLSLPTMCLAAVTRNLTEMMVTAVALVVGGGLTLLLATLVMVAPPEISTSGLSWIRGLVLVSAFALLAMFILPLQYFRRRTLASRGLVILGVLVFALAWSFIPWAPSYALQQRIDPSKGNSAFAIHAADANALGQGQNKGVDDTGVLRGWGFRSPVPSVHVTLPIRISGAAEESILILDRAFVRLRDAQGSLLYEASTRLFSNTSARIDSKEEGDAGERVSVQDLNIPRSVFLKVRGQPLRLEIDYDITEMARDPEIRIRAAQGEISDWSGRSCVTRFDVNDGDIDLRCLSALNVPSCASVEVINTETGERNPTLSQCRPSYVLYPFRDSPLSADLVKRFGVDLPTYERGSDKALPVGPSAVGKASVRIATYRVASHYSRQLVIPGFRVSD